MVEGGFKQFLQTDPFLVGGWLVLGKPVRNNPVAPESSQLSRDFRIAVGAVGRYSGLHDRL